MKIDVQETVRPLHAALRVGSEQPPKSAVGALLTLMPVPEQIVTTRRHDGDRHEWRIVARDETGLAIVSATSEQSWSFSDFEEPVSGMVRAKWVPYGAVASVEVAEIERHQSIIDGGEIVGRETWIMNVAGEALSFRWRELAEEADVEKFCRAVIEATAR